MEIFRFVLKGGVGRKNRSRGKVINYRQLHEYKKMAFLLFAISLSYTVLVFPTFSLIIE